MTAGGRRRRVRCISLTAEEWAECEAAAAAAPFEPGTSEREKTAGAWIRRVALKEAARIRRQGEARPEPDG